MSTSMYNIYMDNRHGHVTDVDIYLRVYPDMIIITFIMFITVTAAPMCAGAVSDRAEVRTYLAHYVI